MRTDGTACTARTAWTAWTALGTALIALVALTGCGEEAMSGLGPAEMAERNALVEALRSADKTGIHRAFGLLDEHAYTRYIRTEQYDVEDFLLAYTEYVAHFGFSDGERTVRLERADSAGDFQFGFFKGFVSENVENVDPVNLVPFVLDEDPIYLDPRNMDKYAFRELADTLLWDRQARVIEIRARPDKADGLNVRRVRWHIDRETNEVVAMSLERIDLALLFREESMFYVHVRQDGDTGALPYNTRFETLIKTPFRGSYRLRTVSTYTDYRHVSGGATLPNPPAP